MKHGLYSLAPHLCTTNRLQFQCVFRTLDDPHENTPELKKCGEKNRALCDGILV